LIVIASIHQPSSGKTHYFGPVADLGPYYDSIGVQVPLYVNMAEFLLELVNVDFASDRSSASRRLDEMQVAWTRSARAADLSLAIQDVQQRHEKHSEATEAAETAERGPSPPSLVVTLLHRSFVKSYRDVVVYGIRIAMYTGLALMMGTVWLRLAADQSSIIPFTNAIVRFPRKGKGKESKERR
jgi:hypothetical protein